MNNGSSYFNKKSLKCSLVIILIYLVSWLFLFDRESQSVGYGVNFYLNFFIVLMFLLKFDKIEVFSSESERYELPFNFSAYLFSIWLGVMEVLNTGETSSYTGVTIIICLVCAFPFLIESIRLLNNNDLLTALAKNFLRLSFVLLFLFSLYILISGEWFWYVSSLDDWINVN